VRGRKPCFVVASAQHKEREHGGGEDSSRESRSWLILTLIYNKNSRSTSPVKAQESTILISSHPPSATFRYVDVHVPHVTSPYLPRRCLFTCNTSRTPLLPRLSLQLLLYCADATTKQGFLPRTRADLNAMTVAQLNAATVAYTGAQAFAGRKEEKVDFLYHLLGGQRFLTGQRP